NETGTYSHEDYDRGAPFNAVSKTSGLTDKALGYFPRNILQCLTKRDAEGQPVRYKVQWTMDAGENWYDLDAKIEFSVDEFALYIAEPNLAEIRVPFNADPDNANNTIFNLEGYCFHGMEVNFWTSLIYQYAGVLGEEDPFSFKDGEWTMRLRITCSVQLDDRLISETDNIAASTCRHAHEHVLPYTNRFRKRKREASSYFANKQYWPDVDEYDETAEMQSLQASVDRANRYARWSGSFDFPWIYLAEGAVGEWRMPRFMVGDCIEGMAGRGLSF
ncbi:unnamed protein product, partial [marine sediment metagenome]